MKKLLLLSLLAISLIFSSCYKSFRQEIPETWEALDFTAEYPIKNVFTTGNELYVATVGEFIRFDKDHKIIEQRQLDIGERVYGRPMISKNVFTRIIRPHLSQNKQVVEFHLTKTKSDVKKFESDQIATDVNENLGIVFNGNYTGAFNANGTQFLLPTTSSRNASYSFFLFDIKLNEAKTKFVSVKVVRRINIPEIPPDADALSNIKFLNGNYYVASQAGAFRIKPDGSYTLINSEWFLDAFEKDGNLFITGFESGNFFVSENNGVSWERVPLQSPTLLTLVSVVNEKVLTQRNEFSLYQLADENLQGTLPIKYNTSFSTTFADSYNMVYFNEQYYLSVSKKIYRSKELVLDL